LRRQEAEDLAQAALEKAIRERPRAGAPPADVRALAHLHHVGVDWGRRRQTRTRREFQDEVDLDRIPAAADEGTLMRRVIAELSHDLGPEEFEFVLMRLAGFLDAEISTMSGWSERDVTRIRRRLLRSKSSIVNVIMDR
jgi:DNA-directed RNA polymerase specialized sigma24 family protein